MSKGAYSYKEKGWNYKWKLKKFAIIDINKDGVKEMIAGELEYGPALIFAYNGKKAVRLCTEYTHQSLVKFTYNPKQKSLYFSRSANASYVEHRFVKVTSKGKLQRTILIMDWENGKYYWTKNGKKISKKTWQKLDAKLRGSNPKSIRFYTNTSANRKKIGSFQIADLDGNGVPELIAYHANGYKNGTVYIYTFKKGKVARVKNKTKSYGGTYGISAVSSADGYYSIYKCSKNHLHLKWKGTATSKFSWSETAYKISGGKVTEYLSKNVDKMYGKTVCKKNGKTVSAKTYSALRKKCKVKNSYYLQSNTAANRKKYVK